MKKIAFCAMVTAIVLLASVSAPAQENSMAVGAGFDVMLPVASFGDQFSTGFGGTAQFDYAVTTHTTVTGKIGYLSWSGKQSYYTSAAITNFSASYSGVPILVGVKYYPHLFVTQAQTPVRVYGHLELGLMFGSASASGTYKGYFGTYSLSTSASKTDFTIVPSIGAEIPVVPKGAIDVSVRYFDIASHGNIGFRAGYRMTIG
jgi:hypothetical protein